MTLQASDQSAAQRRTRVIVVDDSRLMRRMIATGLEEDGTIEVIAEAENTSEARQLIRTLNPDVITLDVEMPGMNGIDFLKKIMELRPMPVIMVSTLTAAGTDVSLAALQIGAVDAIQKPAGRDDVARFGRALREKVHLARGARIHTRASARPAQVGTPVAAPRPAPRRTAPRSHRPGRTDLIAIGASTGGVRALTQLLEVLPANTPPIVITQHMPDTFTSRFAARLDGLLPHNVSEAVDGEVLQPNTIRIAPGDRHLRVQRSGGALSAGFDESGPISGHRPSVDVLFNSVSTAVGASAIGVILTGMGRDGAAGLRSMRNTGAYCIGQSEESCVVYGMPKAAVELQAIDEQLDLGQIPVRICEFLNLQPGMKSA